MKNLQNVASPFLACRRPERERASRYLFLSVVWIEGAKISDWLIANDATGMQFLKDFEIKDCWKYRFELYFYKLWLKVIKN